MQANFKICKKKLPTLKTEIGKFSEVKPTKNTKKRISNSIFKEKKMELLLRIGKSLKNIKWKIGVYIAIHE